MWECSKCKEIIEEQFDACWNCGTKYGKNSRSFQEKVGNFLINSIPESKMLSAKPTKKIEEYASSEEKIIPSNTNNTIEGVILTTTPTIESRMVKKYIGIVCGDAILGANVFRDILAGITDFVGFRSGVYESKLSKAREIALSEMARKAKDIGANAVLSISIDYETIRGSMLMVICTGTAVEIDGQ